MSTREQDGSGGREADAPVLSAGEFDTLFPFSLTIDRTLEIRHAGPGARKLWPDVRPGERLDQLFRTTQDDAPISVGLLERHTEQMLLLHHRATGLRFRGGVYRLSGLRDALVFVGTPMFRTPSDLGGHGLDFWDFPAHDATIDLLFQQTNSDNAAADRSRAIKRLEEERLGLRRAQAKLALQRDVLTAIQRSTNDFLKDANLGRFFAGLARVPVDLAGLDAVAIFQAADGVDPGSPPSQRASVGAEFSPALIGLLDALMDERGDVVCFRTDSDPWLAARAPDLGLGSSCVVAVRLQEARRTKVLLLASTPDPDADRETLVTLGNLLAGAIGPVVRADETGTRLHAAEEDALRNRLLAEQQENLVQEVHHRVKNNIQIATSVLFLQEARTTSPELAAQLSTARNRLASIAYLHELLYRSQAAQRVPVDAMCTEIARLIEDAFGASHRGIRVVAAVPRTLTIDANKATAFGLIVNELVTNAFKHAFPKGRPGSISVHAAEDRTGTGAPGLVVEIRDDGAGLDAAVPPESTHGVGMRIVGRLVRQLQGSLTSTSSDKGTTWTLVIPNPT